jgi:hypothetical protein
VIGTPSGLSDTVSILIKVDFGPFDAESYPSPVGFATAKMSANLLTALTRENSMNPQVNWQKLRGELNKLADVGKLKQDLQKIASELRKFDFHTILTPEAKERVKTFEKKYAELIKTVHQAQRQVDREVNKILRQVKGSAILADVKLENIRRVAFDQRERLNKVTQDLRKRFAKTTKKKGKRKSTGTRKTKTTAS